jgi:hypothetical protein
VSVPLPRAVNLTFPYTVGKDVTAHKRAVYRYIGASYAWNKFRHANWVTRRTYGPSFNRLVDDARHKAGLVSGGGVDKALYTRLRLVGAYDAYGDLLLSQYAAAHPSLTPQDRFRSALSAFCMAAEANERSWHYSQDRPVKVNVNPSGSYIVSDCSGYVIQAYYSARKTSGLLVPDPSKWSYSGYGNTDLHLNDHPHVSGQFLAGDLAHYPGHVTLCRRDGTAQTAVWSSHGSEAGPIPVSLHYRGDFLYAVRPPQA